MTQRYHPDSEQVAFAGAVSKSLSSILPLSRLHDYQEGPQSWADLHHLGIFEIGSSAHGDAGALGAVEEALIAIELGRRVVAPSVSATMGALHLREAANRWLAPAEGRVAAGYRRGDRVVFAADAAATLLLVRSAAGAALFRYPRESHEIDAQLWSSDLRGVGELGECLAEASAGQVLRLRLLDAAVLAGVARAALDMAVGYAGLREQFGRPIGSFQAVKHHCANMAIAARLAADLVAFAAVAVEDGREDAALTVESALYVAGNAALENSGKNIQIHGGMGFSDEAEPHRLLKRTRVLLEIAGGLSTALERVGDASPGSELTVHAQGGRA